MRASGGGGRTTITFCTCAGGELMTKLVAIAIFCAGVISSSAMARTRGPAPGAATRGGVDRAVRFDAAGGAGAAEAAAPQKARTERLSRANK